MEVRPARPEEFDAVRALVPDPTVELVPGRVWCTFADDGSILAVAPLQLCWLVEPLVVAPDRSRVESSRALYLAYSAAMRHISQCSTPVLPPRRAFGITYSPRVKRWANSLGWLSLFEGATFLIKHLPRRRERGFQGS